MKDLNADEALFKAAAYCSSSEHCLFEVKEKLRSWGVNNDDVDKIVEYLVKEKYVDECRFCHSFVHDKFRFNKWGRLKIIQALRQKQVVEDIILKSINEIDEKEYKNMLCGLINSKRKTIKAKNEFELKGKLMRFALSRGFEMNAINQCINLPDNEG